MRGFAETAKFTSLIRAAKFKGAVCGSVKFQRAKSKRDFARRLQAAPRNLKDCAHAYLSDHTVRKSRCEISSARALFFLKPGARRKDTAAKQSARRAGKIYRHGRRVNLPQWVKILNKFKQAFDAAHRILIKFRRAFASARKISQRNGSTPIKI